MLSVQVTDTVGVGNLIVAAAGVIFAIPGYIMARRAIQTANIARTVKDVLAGDDAEIPRRSPENPTLVDLLTEIRDNTARTKEIAEDLSDLGSDLTSHILLPPKVAHGGLSSSVIWRWISHPHHRQTLAFLWRIYRLFRS